MSSFFKSLNRIREKRRVRREARESKNAENPVNDNPTEEESKNNKNGRVSLLLSIVSCLLYVGVLMLVVSTFKSNVFLGFLSILLIPLVTIVQNKAVDCAQKQRKINGKGFIKLIIAKYLVPLFALCAILGLIFGIGLLI